jgi:hypothetical protein
MEGEQNPAYRQEVNNNLPLLKIILGETCHVPSGNGQYLYRENNKENGVWQCDSELCGQAMLAEAEWVALAVG